MSNFPLNCRPCNFIMKETLAQMFSCEFYEISKNTLYYKIPLMAASVFQNFENFKQNSKEVRNNCFSE